MQFENSVGHCPGISGRDAVAGAGLFDNLGATAFHAVNQGRSHGHELEDFGWNYGFENIVRTQVDDAYVQSRQIGGNFVVGHEIAEHKVCDVAIGRFFFELGSIGALADDEEANFWFVAAEFGRVEYGFQAVRGSHRPDVGRQKIGFLDPQFFAGVEGNVVGIKGLGIDAVGG